MIFVVDERHKSADSKNLLMKMEICLFSGELESLQQKVAREVVVEGHHGSQGKAVFSSCL